MLTNGVPTIFIENKLAMGESSSTFFVNQFAMTVVEVVVSEYLRASSADDTMRFLKMNKTYGFTHMLGSIGCMRWKWKNCLAAW